MFEKQTSSNIEDIHLMHLYLSAPCSVSVLVLIQAATQEEHELKGHLFFPVKGFCTALVCRNEYASGMMRI